MYLLNDNYLNYDININNENVHHNYTYKARTLYLERLT